jgi:glycosyltransferase involved in cell wall biosynthesis
MDSPDSIAPTISVVVPVYNSAGSLRELVLRLLAVLDQAASCSEIILVNDGSRDSSWVVIRELTAVHGSVRGIDLMRNYGQHNALLCGIRQARYEITVTLDDDLQHPPETLPLLLAHLSSGCDVVYGTPIGERHDLWRVFASRITKLALQSSMGTDVASAVSAFRAFRTQLRDAFDDYHGPFVSIDVLLTWGTTRFGSVPVRHEPRRIGVSNYTLRKLLVHAANMITGFSTVPLQIATLTGFLSTLFGIVVLFYVLARYLIENSSPPGFPFLASVIAIFSGAQLFALGTIGEYLARMHFRMMEKPAYVVRSAMVATSAAARDATVGATADGGLFHAGPAPTDHAAPDATALAAADASRPVAMDDGTRRSEKDIFSRS